MNTSDIAKAILTVGNVPIPGNVAATLIAALPEQELPNNLLNTSCFSGSETLAVARTSSRRAELIAGNTTDQLLLRALFECEVTRPAALPAMVNNNRVSDSSLWIDIHRWVWGDHPDVQSASFDKLRQAAAIAAPLEFTLEFATRTHAKHYPLLQVAHHVGVALANPASMSTERATAVWTVLEDVDAFDRSYDYWSFCSTVGKSMGRACEGDALYEALLCVERQLSSAAADAVILSAVPSTNTVTRALLSMVLVRVQSPAAFASHQANSPDARLRRKQPAPSPINEMHGMLTADAFELLAATFPAALTSLVGRLQVDDCSYEQIVDTALATNPYRTALTLLERDRIYMNRPNLTVLNPTQFHRAVSAVRHSKEDSSLHKLRVLQSVEGVLRAIPSGAADDDVVALVGLCVNPAQVLERLILRRNVGIECQYEITAAAATRAASALDVNDCRLLVRDLLHMWNLVSLGDEDLQLPTPVAGFDAIVDEIVDALPAAEVAMMSSASTRYLACKLTEWFGTDSDRWWAGMQLLSTSLAPLSRTLRAATRL